MNRFIAFVAALLLAPCYMSALNARAEDKGVAAKERKFDTVSISIKTNDQIVDDSLKKRLGSYMESRLREIGVKSFPTKDMKSGARLILSFHIGYENDLNKHLGYEHENQRKYLVFMEMSLEEPVTVNGGALTAEVASIWTSGMERQASKKNNKPFVSNKTELDKHVTAELKNLMGEFLAFYKTTGGQ
ncbi:hypothetical protein MNBD_NITROSPINAE04-1741 [hydrothermal vent metagenome]|uniref:Uncharacterized protein n=1 Tax=hydrothermal vent metagenome TaxID=652676 RepID=A0A3B1CMU8_9ZZZZ